MGEPKAETTLTPVCFGRTITAGLAEEEIAEATYFDVRSVCRICKGDGTLAIACERFQGIGRPGRVAFDVQRRCRMSDEKPVPETLETLAQRIAALPTKADLERFATKADLEPFATKADFEPFATRADLAELKSQLRTDIQALRADVKLVYDVVIAQDARNKVTDKDLKALKKQLNKHDLRILALEKKDRRA